MKPLAFSVLILIRRDSTNNGEAGNEAYYRLWVAVRLANSRCFGSWVRMRLRPCCKA
jgi:hypothetical protein